MAVNEIEDDVDQRAGAATASNPPKIQQPKPQALPSRAGPSSILVSPRQKGNPILSNVRTVPWEYSDIPCDYVLGATTCALFLSLKYHRLHPEYIYNRIQKLKGMYNLRILLTMVDISNHEEPLKELSKTSIINNVTVILCWSAQEAGRYLELFKTYEHAAPTSIKAHQSTSYSDKMVDFITVPRSINKTDAVGLVSNFGSIRTAVNAQPEEIALIAGWGEKKVQRWCNSVREPFRVRKTARRHLGAEDSRPSISKDQSQSLADHTPALSREVTKANISDQQKHAVSDESFRRDATSTAMMHGTSVDDAAMPSAVDDAEPFVLEEEVIGNVQLSITKKRKPEDDELSEGVMAALAKLRHKG